MTPKKTQPAQQKTCKWWVEPGHGYITDFPHTCTRKAGHGPDENYCWQHARMCGREQHNPPMCSYQFYGHYWHPAIIDTHWIDIQAPNIDRARELLEAIGREGYVYTLQSSSPLYA